MISAVPRGGGYALAGSAAMLLATSLGAGQVLNAAAASSHKVVFAENPVAGVTIPTAAPTTAPPLETTASTTASAPATTAAPPVTTTSAPVAWRWSAHIVAGGIAGDVLSGPSDQFAVTVTNPAWANQSVNRRSRYEQPAGPRPMAPDAVPPHTAVADENGTVTFVVPIGPEAQGGAVSFSASVTQPDPVHPGRVTQGDVCDWHRFAIDYNGPEGLVGGLLASAAKNLNDLSPQ